MGIRINDPDYPLGIKGKDFLVKVYLEMISYLTIDKNLLELHRNASKSLKPGEHFDIVTQAVNDRFKDLKQKRKGGKQDA